LSEELCLKPSLLGPKLTIELQMTDRAEGLEITGVLIARLLVEVSNCQKIASGSRFKLSGSRCARSPPALYPPEKVGQRFTGLTTGPLTLLTTLLGLVLNLERKAFPIVWIPGPNDWHGNLHHSSPVRITDSKEDRAFDLRHATGPKRGSALLRSIAFEKL
jgi:hypothetical protein